MAATATPGDEVGRRAQVVRSAVSTFARFGYRRTSMEQVAHDAGISRPGLYFLFDSKPALFREAVTWSLEEDLAAAERALTTTGAPLPERLLAGFDQWAGRYVGPLTRDVATLVEDNPDVLGTVVHTAPQRFADLVTAALATHDPKTAAALAQTLISTSIGIKHQVDDRQAYLERLQVAVGQLLPDSAAR